MRIIGLVGGIGSGKSTVAAMLRDLGATVFDADRAGHIALDEPSVRQALVGRWSEAVLDRHGRIDRAAVAARVFGQSETQQRERRFLEGVVHPWIRRQLEAEINSLSEADVRAVVVDAALLFEAGWDAFCTMVLLVQCPREDRRRRAAQRGWSAEEFADREAAQMPIEEKRRRCSHVVENSGTLDQLQLQIKEFWRKNVDPTDATPSRE